MLLPLLFLAATVPATIDDESKVPPYTLPDPLVDNAGNKVVDAKQWRESRRPEVMKLVEENIYGRSPDTRVRQQAAVSAVVETDAQALGGRAMRTQLKVWPIGKSGPAFDLLLYVPNGAKAPVPAFLGLNFGGNHTAVEDKAVLLPSTWVSKQWAAADGSNRATEKGRGSQASRWQVETLIARGYALATVY